MSDTPWVPESDEVLAEHERRDDCDPDCLGCRMSALVKEIMELPPAEQLCYADALSSCAVALFVSAIQGSR